MDTETKLAHMQRQIRLMKLVGIAGAILILIGGVWIIVNGLRGSSIVENGSPGGGITVIGDPPPPKVNPLKDWKWEMKDFEKYFKILDKEFQPDKKRIRFHCKAKYTFERSLSAAPPGRKFTVHYCNARNVRLETMPPRLAVAFVWDFSPEFPQKGELVDVYFTIPKWFYKDESWKEKFPSIRRVVIESSGE